MTPAPRPSDATGAPFPPDPDPRDAQGHPNPPKALSGPRDRLIRIAARLARLNVHDSDPDLLDDVIRQIARDVRAVADSLPHTPPRRPPWMT